MTDWKSWESRIEGAGMRGEGSRVLTTTDR